MGDSSWQAIKTEPIDIVVESLNPDEAGDIRDIKPPMTPPKDYRLLIKLVVFGLLVLAAIFFVLYYIKRMHEGKSLIPTRTPPPRPAHEMAFAELEKLKKSDLLANGKIKQYYTVVSDIVRQYIEGRYFIPAMEMTTTQLFSALHEQSLDEKYIDMISAILMKSDLVKFAKFIPSADEHQQIWQLSFDFVDETKLVFEPETETVEDDLVVEKVDSVEAVAEDDDV